MQLNPRRISSQKETIDSRHYSVLFYHYATIHNGAYLPRMVDRRKLLFSNWYEERIIIIYKLVDEFITSYLAIYFPMDATWKIHHHHCTFSSSDICKEERDDAHMYLWISCGTLPSVFRSLYKAE